MDDNDKFLEAISQIESSGGKNLSHPTVKRGIHKGMHGVGQYALMPLTIDTLNNAKRRDKKFGPDENVVSQLNNDELDQFFKDNPRVETNYANQLADFVRQRVQNLGRDDETAAYLWNQGQNTKEEKLTDDVIQEHPYVQKFKLIKEMMDNKYAK
jgi:hypothetical protein